jgi:mannose-6-phosphate isomerase-like protein (cupin superfamily)
VARAGESLEHPVTGERLIFCETSADTDGELLRFDFWMRPRGFVAAAHFHPQQEERFVVHRGSSRFRIAGDERDAGAGEAVVVPPGVPHVWWNPGDEEVHATVEFRPALRTEQFFEVFFGLGAAGKTNRRGLPNPLWLAAIGDAFSDEVRLARIPWPLARAGTAAVAPLARLLGYRPTPDAVRGSAA